MKRASLIKIVLCFLLVIVFANITQGQDLTYREQPFVSEELWNMTMARDTTTRVLVTLRQSPNSLMQDATRHVQEIASLQGSVLSALPAGSYRDVKQLSHLPVMIMHIDRTALESLAKNPSVEAVNPDHMMYTTDVQADAITRIGAVQALGYTGKNIRVAVMDTGIDTDHPNLFNDIIFQRCLLYASNQTTNTCANPNSAEDGQGHGTHVSGIITGSGGVARDAKIAAFKVLSDSGTGYSSNTIDSLNYIVQNNGTLGIKVINMSLGGQTRYSTESSCDSNNAGYRSAISNLNSLGIVVFAATGNDGSTTGVSSPGCNTGVIGVGSTDDAALTLQFSTCTLRNQTDGVSCYSNTHSTQGPGEVIDILAPGCLINAEAVGGGMVNNCGTSMASPMAAGIAAALLEARPNTTPAEMENLLEATGNGVVDYRNGVTYPRINAENALNQLLGGPSTPVPPTATPVSQAPANDNFANALNITPGYVGNTTNFQHATIQSGDPAHSCRYGGAGTGYANIWYRFTLSQTSNITLSTQGSQLAYSSGTNEDTTMTLYSGSSLSNLSAIACHEDVSGSVLYSTISRQLNAGTYYVQVSSWSNSAMTEASYVRLAFTATGTATNTPVPPTATNTPVPPTATNTPVPPTATQVSQAPANDHFANALNITSGYAANTVNFEYATIQSGDPAHTCRYGGAGTGYANIWYRFTLTQTATISLSTQGSRLVYGTSTNEDTTMSLYSGSSLSNLSAIACHEDVSGSVLYSTISRQLNAGTYYVQVSSWRNTAMSAGSYVRLAFNVTGVPTSTPMPPTATPTPESPIPSNDNFANALVIPSGYVGNTLNFEYATVQAADPVHSCRYGGAGKGYANVWYRFTLNQTSNITLSTQGSRLVYGSSVNEDTTMSIFTGSSLSNLTAVACHEDVSGSVLYSYISRQLNAGTYYVLVSTWSNSTLSSGSYARLAYNATSSISELPMPSTSIELLSNGGFEINDTKPFAQPDGWKRSNASKDRLTCNTENTRFAVSGTCAFRFQGGNGENAILRQTVKTDDYIFNEGDLITASFQYRTNNVAPRLKLKLSVIYTDPALGKDKVNLTVKTVSQDYQLIDAAQITVKGSVSKIKYQLNNRAARGKVFIDNASLTLIASDGPRMK